MPTKKQLQAELEALKAQLRGETPMTTSESSEGFGGWQITRNDKNSDAYGVEYAFLRLCGSDGKPLAQVKGNSEAEAAKKALKSHRYGAKGQGRARYNKAAKAWSIQTDEIPAFVLKHRVK